MYLFSDFVGKRALSHDKICKARVGQNSLHSSWQCVRHNGIVEHKGSTIVHYSCSQRLNLILQMSSRKVRGTIKSKKKPKLLVMKMPASKQPTNKQTGKHYYGHPTYNNWPTAIHSMAKAKRKIQIQKWKSIRKWQQSC